MTESVWADLSDLKRPGETFSQLLEEMIEREKKGSAYRSHPEGDRR
ncbi:MAG: hypothetical protein WCY97_06915 [Methanothrix sp.]|nr:hypothetical protein [Methanothrix sp.]MDD3709676.1 hypothetical protein [Methanothrix sp.]MDD5767840.1 hypothetical protein [Methanothrix sp.]MDI9400148.1 hypothetical protein [Euryarchaeota archaeon]